ncbi:MAG: beta strand repeat-containing protein, partial [Rhodospirillaceae bacterium]
TKFSMEIDPIGAAFFNQVDARLLLSNAGSFLAGGFYTVAASGNCTSITALTTKIILDGCGGLGNKISQTNGANTDVSASYAGVIFSGVSFNNASALATVGATIGINGLVYNASNPSQTFESITAATVLTSAAPITATIVSGGTATANASATPVAFAYFTTGTAAPTILSANLANVDISSTGALAVDLATVVIPDGAAGTSQAFSSIQVTITSGELSQAAALAVTASTSTAINNFTVANFSAGVATFSVNSGVGLTSFTIQVAFSGTTALTAASAGTVTIGFGIGSSMGQVVPAVTGKTGSISLGGFNAELNTFLTSANSSYSSYARIHNNGIIAGPATVTVRNDATGVTMGTYTTASIATNQTLQISAKDIETGAGITAAAGVNYTLSIAGAFSGYAQHIIFNPATGQLADLSSFRNRAASGGVTTP